MTTLRQYYDAMAGAEIAHYQHCSRLNRWLVQDVVTRFVRRRLRRAARGATSILDVGCGDGGHALTALLNAPSATEIILNDLSPRMVEQAQQRIAASGIPVDIVPIVDDLGVRSEERLPKASLVVCCGVLNHVAGDLSRFIGRIAQMAQSRTFLAFCHASFVLAPIVGRGLRRQGLPFRPVAVSMVREMMANEGHRLVDVGYPYRVGVASPLATLTFVRDH